LPREIGSLNGKGFADLAECLGLAPEGVTVTVKIASLFGLKSETGLVKGNAFIM